MGLEKISLKIQWRSTFDSNRDEFDQVKEKLGYKKSDDAE